ncbi:hypothetical protein BV22DRAFT_1096427 [Leucogyrophana mollusca]|uniref:Uncharacterized protein n=1 Tax=Leucogyrophana mollusca TaxID=85980 RepID=A0ACB8B6R1_9AGAM|nr:hypothetical protein BV22DRAFT_1096427 [Leucogyrophana mollusca]
MDLNPVGTHCSLASCNALDFLPIRCRCDYVFCRFHILPSNHECTAETKQLDPDHRPTFEQKLQRCGLHGCNKPSLDAAVSAKTSDEERSSASCARCQLSFCVDHRYPEAHSCSGSLDSEPVEKNGAARVLLAKHFTNSSYTSPLPPTVVHKSARPPTDPKKLAQLQKVALMKMRHRAQPGDPKDKSTSVAVEQRLHITAKTDVTGISGEERIFWFRKASQISPGSVSEADPTVTVNRNWQSVRSSCGPSWNSIFAQYCEPASSVNRYP